MTKQNIKIRSREGGAFDAYVVAPAMRDKTPGIVLASAVHGVNEDIRAIANVFADNGYIALAPDLFWRTLPGPLGYDDDRSATRSQPRLEKIKTGEIDLADSLNELCNHEQFNGRAAVIGFCYGGPYAILGPKRLGFEAGISCHGTSMLDYIDELDSLDKRVCVVWGDKDHVAPPAVLDAYRAAAARMSNVELHIFPGVAHGYMFRGNAKAFNEATYHFSMSRALAMLEKLRKPTDSKPALG